MRSTTPSRLVVAYSLVSSVSALQVTPGSSCASTCLDSSSGDPYSSASSTTNASDIVCKDSDYFSSPTGVKFKDCLECLKTSKEVNGSESDSSWFLYNLRFASAVCLYDYPKHRENSISSCDLSSACLPLQTALETGLNLSQSQSNFGYCSADDSAFYGTSIDDCVSCLQSSSDTYGANFLLTLQAGCKQQPAAGTLLSISGDIFSEYPINYTSSPSNTNSTSSSSSTRSKNDAVLSEGAIIGIACGVGGLLLAAIMLFGVHWRRQKRWQKDDDVTFVDPHDFYGKGFTKHGGGGSSGMTTLTSANSYHHHQQQQPRFTYDHKTPTPQPTYQAVGAFSSGQEFEMDYTHNAEYYDRMEGKSRGRPLLRPATASPPPLADELNSAAHVDAAALPAHPAYIPRDRLTPSRVGSRASHRSTPSARSEDGRQQQRQQQQHPKYNKPDPYTIQVYLNSVEDSKIPPSAPPNPLSQHPTDGISRDVGIHRETSLRDIKIELTTPSETSAPYVEYPTTNANTTTTTTDDNNYNYNYHNHYTTTTNNNISSTNSTASLRQGGRNTPTPTPQGGRSTPAPASGRSTPAPGAARDSGAPRAPSLILPTAPRMRGSSKRPPKLSIGGEAPPSLVIPRRSESIDITGPLAFPDRRFKQRSGDDRIVEQTVDRAGHPHFVEVPIGSGKSYLYG